MNAAALLAALAGILGLVQILPYVRSILRGITRPSRIATSIWTASNAITVASVYATGARAALVLPLAFTIANLTVALLSIKYGVREFTKNDLVNGLLAFCGLIAWVVLGPRATVAAMAIAQITGAIAVLGKLRKHPGTEDRAAWAIAAIASALSIGAIVAEGNVDLAVIAVPALSGLGCLAVLALAAAQKPTRDSGIRFGD